MKGSGGRRVSWQGQEGVKSPACWGRTPSWCPGPLKQPGQLAWQTSHQDPSVPRPSHQEEAACCLCGPAGVGVDQPSVPGRPAGWERAHPWQAAWRGWLAEGEPEHPGVVRASLSEWVPGPPGMKAERDIHPGLLAASPQAH